MRPRGTLRYDCPMINEHLVDPGRKTTIFGVKYPAPIFIAPIGVQGIFHPDAELASASAARNQGIPYIMSTASSRSIEEVAQANGDGHRWYQLYWYLRHTFDPMQRRSFVHIGLKQMM